MEMIVNIPAWSQVTEVELVYKNKVKIADRPVVKTSQEAALLFRAGWNDHTMDLQEAFKVLYLNRSSHVIGGLLLSIGSVSGTVADPRLIFTAALKLNASALILCHNHPSGNTQPSRADLDMTLKIRNAGLLLEIRVMDHIILTSESHFSFADAGLL